MPIVKEKESRKILIKPKESFHIFKCKCKRTSDIYSKEKRKHIQQWQFNRASKAVNHHLILSDEYQPPFLYRHETNSDLWVSVSLFIYWGLLLVFGWLPYVAAAPRCSDWPRDPAAAGLLRRWSRRPDTPEQSNPRIPHTGSARSGHHRRWLVLYHSPDTLLAGEAGEWCEGEACYCGCCCVSGLLRGFGCPPGSGFDHVLEGAGFCPSQWWGSRMEGSPGRPLPRCHGHCLGHNWQEDSGRREILN